jgi:hypothetical protein
MKVVRHAALLLLLASAARGEERFPCDPPAGAHLGGQRPSALETCVTRHFRAHAADPAPATDSHGNGVCLADGRVFPISTHAIKTNFEQLLDAPDIQDMLWAQRYRRGKIVPVTTVDDDPGRIRFAPLFEVTWPKKALVTRTFFAHPVHVQPTVAEALARVEKKLAGDPSLAPFFEKLGGTFNDRKIAGTERTSAHAWGIAIDINPAKSNYWRWEKGGWKNAIPQKIVDAFEDQGFIWGGRWYHFDTMHFEYRPEMLDPACLMHPEEAR